HHASLPQPGRPPGAWVLPAFYEPEDRRAEAALRVLLDRHRDPAGRDAYGLAVFLQKSGNLDSFATNFGTGGLRLDVKRRPDVIKPRLSHPGRLHSLPVAEI